MSEQTEGKTKLTKKQREVIAMLKSLPGSWISPGKDQPGYRTGWIQSNSYKYHMHLPYKTSMQLLDLGLLQSRYGYLYLKS